MQGKLVIIGGVAAGMSTASKARRINPNMAIEVYTDDKFISYAGCGLPYFIGNKISSQEMLLARTIEQFTTQNITVNTQHTATVINKENQTITVKKILEDTVDNIAYDRLVIATGARPIIPPWEGVNLKGIFALRNIHDSLKIREYLADYQPKKAVIIGGGYIGLEMVENLMEYDCDITLIEQNVHIIPNMDQDMAQIVTNYLISKNITVKADESVLAFDGDSVVKHIITDKGTIEADLVLISIGVHPNSELAKEAGLELGIRNAIRVNKRMETSFPNIYAAGDCATTFHLVSAREVYIPMGTTANKQGKIAGENAAGGNGVFNGVLGTGIARIIDLEISRTGLSEKECQALGIEYISRTIQSKTAARYCTNSADIYVKLVIDKHSHRILGSQIIGYSGAAKRIDVFATAITIKASIEDLINMDLAYSPLFSPVWDPILVALNQF